MRRLIPLLFAFALPGLGQSTDDTSSQRVAISSRTASGTLGADEANVEIRLDGRMGVGGYVGAITTATVVAEVTVDGSNWIGVPFLTYSGASEPTRTMTLTNPSATLFDIEVPAGAAKVRVRVDTYSSGSATCTLKATAMVPALRMSPAFVDWRETEGQNNARPIYCTSTADLDMTTATTTEIVALSGSTHIYVCSFAIKVGGAADVKFVSGTGSNCATSQADALGSPNFDFAAADAGINRSAAGGGVVVRTNDAGDALCVTSSAAVDVDVSISYTQF